MEWICRCSSIRKKSDQDTGFRLQLGNGHERFTFIPAQRIEKDGDGWSNQICTVNMYRLSLSFWTLILSKMYGIDSRLTHEKNKCAKLGLPRI